MDTEGKIAEFKKMVEACMGGGSAADREKKARRALEDLVLLLGGRLEYDGRDRGVAALLLAVVADGLGEDGDAKAAREGVEWVLGNIAKEQDLGKHQIFLSRALVVEGEEPGTKALVGGDISRLLLLKRYKGPHPVGTALDSKGVPSISPAGFCAENNPLMRWKEHIYEDREYVTVHRRDECWRDGKAVELLEFSNGWSGEYDARKLMDMPDTGGSKVWVARMAYHYLRPPCVVLGIESATRLGILSPLAPEIMEGK
jgi:hypothetical protein